MKNIQVDSGLLQNKKSDGGVILADDKSLKHVLFGENRLKGEKLHSRIREVINAKKETAQNISLALMHLEKFPSAETEEILLRFASGEKSAFRFEALKSLAATGSEKTVKSLSAFHSGKDILLERQKDLTLLQLACRFKLPEASQILKRLTGKIPAAKNAEESPLHFKSVSENEIPKLLHQFHGPDYGMNAGKKTAFKIISGEHTFYFFFNSLLENPSNWKKSIGHGIAAGFLLSKERESEIFNHRYFVFATMENEDVLLTVLKKNGELLMLAKLAYDAQKESIILSNASSKIPTSEGDSIRSTENKTKFQIHLSYFRAAKKRKTIAV